MNQHEISLGFSYQGDPIEDIQLISFFKRFINNILDEKKRLFFQRELDDLEGCALNEVDNRDK